MQNQSESFENEPLDLLNSSAVTTKSVDNDQSSPNTSCLNRSSNDDGNSSPLTMSTTQESQKSPSSAAGIVDLSDESAIVLDADSPASTNKPSSQSKQHTKSATTTSSPPKTALSAMIAALAPSVFDDGYGSTGSLKNPTNESLSSIEDCEMSSQASNLRAMEKSQDVELESVVDDSCKKKDVDDVSSSGGEEPKSREFEPVEFTSVKTMADVIEIRDIETKSVDLTEEKLEVKGVIPVVEVMEAIVHRAEIELNKPTEFEFSSSSVVQKVIPEPVQTSEIDQILAEHNAKSFDVVESIEKIEKSVNESLKAIELVPEIIEKLAEEPEKIVDEMKTVEIVKEIAEPQVVLNAQEVKPDEQIEPIVTEQIKLNETAELVEVVQEVKPIEETFIEEKTESESVSTQEIIKSIEIDDLKSENSIVVNESNETEIEKLVEHVIEKLEPIVQETLVSEPFVFDTTPIVQECVESSLVVEKLSKENIIEPIADVKFEMSQENDVVNEIIAENTELNQIQEPENVVSHHLEPVESKHDVEIEEAIDRVVEYLTEPIKEEPVPVQEQLPEINVQEQQLPEPTKVQEPEQNVQEQEELQEQQLPESTKVQEQLPEPEKEQIEQILEPAKAQDEEQLPEPEKIEVQEQLLEQPETVHEQEHIPEPEKLQEQELEPEFVVKNVEEEVKEGIQELTVTQVEEKLATEESKATDQIVNQDDLFKQMVNDVVEKPVETVYNEEVKTVTSDVVRIEPVKDEEQSSTIVETQPVIEKENIELETTVEQVKELVESTMNEPSVENSEQLNVTIEPEVVKEVVRNVVVEPAVSVVSPQPTPRSPKFSSRSIIDRDIEEDLLIPPVYGMLKLLFRGDFIYFLLGWAKIN